MTTQAESTKTLPKKPEKMHVMDELIDTSNILSNREIARKSRNAAIAEYELWIAGLMKEVREAWDNRDTKLTMPSDLYKAIRNLIERVDHENK